MSDHTPTAERLVQIYQARDEWEGTLIVGYLRDNDIEATLRHGPSMPPLDGVETLVRNQKMFGISVLEDHAERAKQLVTEFVSTITDESVLAETAAQHLKLEKETIHQLRRELVEEKKTFEALGWIGLAFCAAAALLWRIWPNWLKSALPWGGFGWMGLLLLVIAALFAGNWANRRMR